MSSLGLNFVSNKNDNHKHPYAHDMIIYTRIWFSMHEDYFYYHLEFGGYIQSFIFFQIEGLRTQP